MKVLLVAPPTIDRDCYLSALSTAGFRVRSLESADDASQTITANVGSDSDLVILDLLPEPDRAWALAADIRRSSPAVPLVIFTALIRPDGANRRRARAMKCAAFVAKPCAPGQLIDVVCRVASGERGFELLKYDPSGRGGSR